MTAIDDAAAALDKAEMQLTQEAETADRLQEAAVLELIRWLPTWWLEQAQTEARERPAQTQALGRDGVRSFRTDVEQLGEGADSYVRETFGSSERLFPHAAGASGVSGAELNHQHGIYLDQRALSRPLGVLMVRHQLMSSDRYDPLHRWEGPRTPGAAPKPAEQPTWAGSGERLLRGDEGVRRALSAYQSHLGAWIHAVRARDAAAKKLEEARADDLWG